MRGYMFQNLAREILGLPNGPTMDGMTEEEAEAEEGKEAAPEVVKRDTASPALLF